MKIHLTDNELASIETSIVPHDTALDQFQSFAKMMILGEKLIEDHFERQFKEQHEPILDEMFES